MVSRTGQVLWELLSSLKGFIPLVLSAKPNVPGLLAKIQVGLVEILPLLAIGWVMQHAIVLFAVS
jgi:hypothetical protein